MAPASARSAFERLERAAADRRGGREELLAATRIIRQEMGDALAGKELTEGSLILERHRSLRHKLDHVDGHVVNEDWDAVGAHLGELRESVENFLREAAGLAVEKERRTRALPAPLVNATTVARKEIVLTLQGVQGLVLFGIFLLTFGLGLEAVTGGGVPGAPPSVETTWRYAHALDFLAVPLAGLLLGYHLINEERTQGTIHFLGSKPVTRGGIVLGKWLGMAVVLGVLVLASAVIVGGVALSISGSLGDPGVVVGFVAATYLLALAFGSVALAMSALLDRGAVALGASLGAYILLGMGWQNAFYLRQLRDAGGAPAASKILLYLASPFTAWWNWTEEMLGPKSDVSGLPVGDAWHEALVVQVERGTLDALPFYATTPFYVLVLVAWCGIGLGLAAWAFRARDAA